MTAPARSRSPQDAPAAPASATRRRLPLGPRYEACGDSAQARPCPAAACRYHLPDPEPSLFGEPSGRPSCALDVASLGGVELDPLGELFGVTGERVRQYIAEMLPRLRKRCEAVGISPRDFMHSMGMPYPEEIPDEPRGRNGGPRRRAPAEEAPSEAAQAMLPWGDGG